MKKRIERLLFGYSDSISNKILLCIGLLSFIMLLSVSAFLFYYDNTINNDMIDCLEGEDQSKNFIYTYISMPVGDCHGDNVCIHIDELYDGEIEKIQWYLVTRDHEILDMICETTDTSFDTGTFDKYEVRYYMCKISSEGRQIDSYFAVGFTGLPVLEVNTLDENDAICKDNYSEGNISIVNEIGHRVYNFVSIKGRGNATWNHPKKPYKIQFQEAVSVLGLEPRKEWILLANYTDKTLMRTSIGFEVSRIVGMEYTPSYRYVELVINGEYLGNYLLVEDVSEGILYHNLSNDGYMVENTSYDDDEQSFRTKKKKLLFQIKFPTSMSLGEREYIKQDIDYLEYMLYSDADYSQLTRLIDDDSWASWFLVQNILQNADTNKYFYKDRMNSNIKIGPVWDFEWSIGIGAYYGERPNPNHYIETSMPYFNEIICYREFQDLIYSKWDSMYNSLCDQLIAYIHDTEDYLIVSQELNFSKWEIMNEQIVIGGIPMGSYEDEVECDVSYLEAHLEWLDSVIRGYTYEQYIS